MLVELADMRGDEGGRLGFKRGGKHAPRTVTHDLVDQRPAQPGQRHRWVRWRRVLGVDYREHGHDADWERWRTTARPLRIGPLLRLDTTQTADTDAVTAWVREQVSTRPAIPPGHPVSSPVRAADRHDDEPTWDEPEEVGGISRSNRFG